MEAIIEKLVELDFDGLALQRTPILLNQANINSVIFNYKIYKGSNEIHYSDYSRAEVVFQKSDGLPIIEDAVITSNGISYILNRHIFDLAQIVKGQINLYQNNTLSATLHYSFVIIPDLSNINRVSKPYVRTVEELMAILNVTVEEAQRILEGLQSEAFATEEFVLTQAGQVNDRITDLISIGDFQALKRGGYTVWDAGNTNKDFVTWTPVLKGGTTAGEFIYSSQDGWAKRIDDMIDIWIRISISNIITAPTGRLEIGSLPYPLNLNNPSSYANPFITTHATQISGQKIMTGFIYNQNTIMFNIDVVPSNWAQITGIAAGFQLVGYGRYRTF